MSPLVMISFGWDGQLTVKILAVCMGLVGVLALGVAAAFFFCRNLISPRVAFLVAVMISVVMYLLSYPYAMTSHPVHPYNETVGTGCDPKQYTWCDTAYATWPGVFLPIICIVMGVGVPTAQISLDTIYSKILGNIDQPAVKDVVKDVHLCDKVSQFNQAKFNEISSKHQPHAKHGSKKEEKKKDHPKPAPKAKEPEADDGAEDGAIIEKAKDPFAEMPKGTFVMDSFKRVYSNEDTATKAIPYFWDNFDAEANSIWFCEYKYPTELTLTFMSCNLISGMFQRLEKLKRTLLPR
ncbi:elongation factor 1 gamma, hypothetical protein [Cooperia oncophora]